MNTIRKHKKLTSLTTTVAYAALALSSFPGGLIAAPALPTGGHVVSGNAAIHQTGLNGLQIDQTSRASIINWGGFSIGEGGTVHFANGSGATLNRVTGGLPSRIDGSLTATGSLYLVNQAGVVVGREGRINTGGSFVASTHDVADSAFLAGGDLVFSGASDALVINAGQIGSLGGDVALIARRVENTGTLTAPQGTVALAAGYEVLARDAALSDGKFLVRIGGSDTEALNAGAIEAAAAELRANGGNVYALAGNTSGIIKATAVNQSGGRIIFDAGDTGSVELAGIIDASAQSGAGVPPASVASQGGLITATGKTVTVRSGATLDASGATGGTILLGGDYQGGKNPANTFLPAPGSLLSAQTTTVEAGSLLRADGLAGDGGNIVVWADGLTTYAGHLSAQALGLTGDGGFAEVSGKALLDFIGTVDLHAAHGAAGTLLLDPFNITIVAGSASGTGGIVDGVWTPTATSTIGATTLQNLLGSANVLVTTGGASPGGDAGNIIVNADLQWDSGRTLELSAYNNITVSRDIDAGSGSVILRADNSGKGTGTVNPAGGVITALGGVQIFFNPGVNTALDTNPDVERNSINSLSYLNPTEDFTSLINSAEGTRLTAYMLVHSIYDLQNLQNNLRGRGTRMTANGSFSYALSKDIDASDTLNWTPTTGKGFRPLGIIPTSGPEGFQTIFDGQGHVISNLFIEATATGTENVGLFGYTTTGAVIRNVGLVDAYIESLRATPRMGGLVGYAAQNTQIDNVFVSNILLVDYVAPTAISSIGGVWATGGIVGNLGGGSVLSNAWASGSIVRPSMEPTTSNGIPVGGLVGSIAGGSSLSDSYSNVDIRITTATAYDVGGVVGKNLGTLTDTYWNNSRITVGIGYGNTAGQGVTGLAPADLQSVASFPGLDFTNVWNAPTAGSPYPTLKSAGGRDFGVPDELIAVTYEFEQKSWAYLSAPPAISYEIHGLLPEDQGAITPTLRIGRGTSSISSFTSFTLAGDFRLSISSLVGDRTVRRKYVLTDNGSTPGNWTITPLPLTITLLNQFKVGGEVFAFPSLSTDWTAAHREQFVSLDGLATGSYLYRFLLSSGGAASGAAPGSYDITGINAQIRGPNESGSGTGTTLTNCYAITIVPGTLTVRAPASLEKVTYAFGQPGYSWQFGQPGTADLSPVTWALMNSSGITLTEAEHHVTGRLTVKNQSGAEVPLTGASLVPGQYTLTIGALLGEGSFFDRGGDYVLDHANSTPGQLTVNKGTLAITLADIIRPLADKDTWTQGKVTPSLQLTGDLLSLFVQSVNGLADEHDLNRVIVAVSDSETENVRTVNPFPLGGPYNVNTIRLYTKGTTTQVTWANFYDLVFTPGSITFQDAPAVRDVIYDFTSNALTSWVYGSDNKGGITWTLNGVDTGDVVTGVLAIKQGDTDVTAQALLNAGTYTLTIGSLTGADADDYQIAATGHTPGSLTVNPKAISIADAATLGSKVYDGTLAANILTHGTLDGLVVGDDAVTLALTAAYGDKNVGEGKAVTGTYALTGAGAGNYTLTGNAFTGTASITPASLTLGEQGTVAASKVYDGLLTLGVLTHGTLSGLVTGDTVTLTLADVLFADKNVGTDKAVTGLYALGGTDAGNYTLTGGSAFTGTASITPKTLTFTATSTVADKIYDGTTAATLVGGSLTGTLNGLVSGDTVNYALEGLAFADKNAGTGKMVNGTIALSGADAANYAFDGAAFTGTASITPKTLTLVSAGDVADKVYDGTTNAVFTGSTFDGVVTGDQVTIGLTGGFADKNVGTAKAVNGSYSLAGTDAGNYELAGGGTFTGTASITPKVITVGTAGTVSNKIYDGTTAATVATHGALAGLITGDAVTLTLGDLAFASRNAGEGKGVTGTYTIAGTDADNYTLTGAAFIGIASITPKQISIGTQGTVAASKVYDGTTVIEVLTTGSLSGLVTGDAVTLALTAAYADKNAGTSKPVTGSYAISGADVGNYTLSGGNAFTGTASITAASLTLTNPGTVANKVYDGTTAATITGAAFTGLFGSDQVTLGLTGGFVDKNVGTAKAVTGNYSLTGTDAGNYVLAGGSAFTGTASITPKTITVGTAGTIANKVYDGSLTATVSTHGALTGLITGDAVTLALGGTAFADKNAGTAKTVTGTYAISGTDAANYVLSNASFTGTAGITQKSLTLGTAGTIAASKVYDGLLTIGVTGNGTLSGIVSGDTVSITLGSTQFADKNVGGNKTVTGTYTLGGADVGNYALTGGNAFTGTASITPATLTIGTQGTVAGTKIYDGTTAIEILTHGNVAGLIGSDNVSLALASAYADKNVGESKDVLGTYTLGGTDAGNYVLTTDAFTGQATITAATLTYTANAASRQQGQSNPAFTGTVTGFVADETLATATTGSLVFTSPANAESAPGSYAINGGGLEAQNYVFVQAAGNATALTVTTATTQPETPAEEILAEFLSNNPVRYETQAGTDTESSLERLLEQFQPAGQPQSSPGSLTTGEDDPEGVHPDNRDLGPWLKIASLR
ncbi:filamentous hemagglutinin N-terminal domain-containing protein [Opitutaceae bacterium TAV4]|nr:filamentous hemagglutinin N-terminal domain-containing protein [Opitutaceae bacterium TAV4]RRK02100.1 filamentous hemagglutinin N-terminal domain-containing protein [Opitutaceae bacterium TAV3]